MFSALWLGKRRVDATFLLVANATVLLIIMTDTLARMLIYKCNGGFHQPDNNFCRENEQAEQPYFIQCADISFNDLQCVNFIKWILIRTHWYT